MKKCCKLARASRKTRPWCAVLPLSGLSYDLRSLHCVLQSCASSSRTTKLGVINLPSQTQVVTVVCASAHSTGMPTHKQFLTIIYNSCFLPHNTNKPICPADCITFKIDKHSTTKYYRPQFILR